MTRQARSRIISYLKWRETIRNIIVRTRVTLIQLQDITCIGDFTYGTKTAYSLLPSDCIISNRYTAAALGRGSLTVQSAEDSNFLGIEGTEDERSRSVASDLALFGWSLMTLL